MECKSQGIGAVACSTDHQEKSSRCAGDWTKVADAQNGRTYFWNSRTNKWRSLARRELKPAAVAGPVAVFATNRHTTQMQPLTTFAELWPMLAAKGWEVQKGNALENWHYKPPCGQKQKDVMAPALHTKGVDYFTSEEAVMFHARTECLYLLRHRKQQLRAEKGDQAGEKDNDSEDENEVVLVVQQQQQQHPPFTKKRRLNELQQQAPMAGDQLVAQEQEVRATQQAWHARQQVVQMQQSWQRVQQQALQQAQQSLQISQLFQEAQQTWQQLQEKVDIQAHQYEVHQPNEERRQVEHELQSMRGAWQQMQQQAKAAQTASELCRQQVQQAWQQVQHAQDAWQQVPQQARRQVEDQVRNDPQSLSRALLPIQAPIFDLQGFLQLKGFEGWAQGIQSVQATQCPEVVSAAVLSVITAITIATISTTTTARGKV
jgi:hypothetical protein